MDQEKARKFITDELCERLKQCIGELYRIILYDSYPNKDTPENFELLKNIASIAGELLSDSKSQKEFDIYNSDRRHAIQSKKHYFSNA